MPKYLKTAIATHSATFNILRSFFCLFYKQFLAVYQSNMFTMDTIKKTNCLFYK